MKLILLSFFLCASSWAADIAWFQFQVNHSYSDSDSDSETACTSARKGSWQFVSVEIEAGAVKRAQLHDGSAPGNKAIDFSEDALKGIEFFKDSKGGLWLKKIQLNERLLSWAFSAASRNFSSCEIPQPLQTFAPALASFEFDSNDLEEFTFSYSKRISFTGTRKDGNAFQAKLQWVQRLFQLRRW